MKRITALLLCMILLGTLTGCGEKTSDNDKKIDSEKVAQEAMEDAEERDSFSVEAVEYYFEKAGNIDIKDVAPEWEYTVQKLHAYADDPSNGYGHGVVIFSKADESEVTPDEYKAWLQKVFDATAKASQDGYNIIGWEFVGEGENALSETTLEDAIGGFMSGWCYRYNDKIMTVYVEQKYDNDKESQIGQPLYYYGVSVDIGVGLQKSFGDTMGEAEAYMEENEEEIKEALSDYTK